IMLPTIGREFDMNQGDLSWIVSAFTLGNGSMLLLSGRTADIFGRRLVFLCGCLWLGLWSIGCGFATTGTQLVICRALQGVGASMTVPSAVGILASTYRRGPRRNYAFALFSAAAPVGFVTRIVLGGLFTETIGWRWLFRFLALINCLFFVSGLYAMPQHEGHVEGERRMDVLGGILFVSGTLILTYSLSAAKFAPQGWSSPHIIILLVLSVLFFGSFIYRQSRISYPLMPLSIWSYPMFAVVMVIGFATWGSF
ncbi:major facilitator superfamily domain-containing protein, partial [Blyttiomyces helicus]